MEAGDEWILVPRSRGSVVCWFNSVSVFAFNPVPVIGALLRYKSGARYGALLYNRHLSLHLAFRTTMIIILAILAASRASPVGLRSPPAASLDQFQAPGPSCTDPNGCRSLTDIIRSCILTILLCTWVSMHPNIPSPDERWPRLLWRRAGLMFLALIAPEAVLGWALRQRQAAAELAMKHKGEGWTITHGFFAVMGGFMEYEGNQPIRVLLPDELESYSLTGNGDFPRISKAEIDDKSKGDAISKGFVVLQTGWFVTQCIARGVQGLPITELELVTVAFATLNFGIYLLWWDKPLNVQRGVRVYKKRMSGEPVDDGDVELIVGFWNALRDTLSGLPAAIVSGPHTSGIMDASWLARVLVWPLYKPFNIMFGGQERPGDVKFEKRVDTFYPSKWGWGTASKYFSVFLVATTTVAFGGIHCIGWSFTFPSNSEQILWRVSSLSITGIPISLLPLCLFVAFVIDRLLLRRRFDAICLKTTLLLLFSLYILSRLALLVLPFLSLRSLPPAAFHIVHWTSFIPHI